MNHLLQKNLMLFASSLSPLQSCTLLVRFQLSKLLSSSPYSHRKRHGSKEYRNVRVSVWWDFETCNLPSGFSISKVKPAVTDAVRANGIKGPVHITAFGDVCQLSRPNQEALPFTGIHLTRFLKIPKGGKYSDDISRITDLMEWLSDNPLMYWVSQNPPPVHLFLISGDKDFAGILHRLRLNNYNILLASPGNAPDVLGSAATMMWQWTSILKGEDLTGKHFNHPPDCQFSSWYGNSKVPLESPFSQNIDVTEINEPSSDLKVGVRSADVSPKVREKYTTLGKLLAGTDHTNKHEDQPRKELDDHSPYFSAVDDSLVDKRPDVHPETYSKRSTFFSWIKSWWPFQKSNVKADDSTFYQKKVTRNLEDSKLSELDMTASNLEEPKPLEQQHYVTHSGKHEGSKLPGSFWNDMESFVFSPKGSLLISQSRSREDLAHKLQKHGPMTLKSFAENDIFQLVELLIADKKWLEESPSQAFPFRLTQSVWKSTRMGQCSLNHSTD